MTANNFDEMANDGSTNDTIRIDREQLEKALEEMHLQQQSFGASSLDESSDALSVLENKPVVTPVTDYSTVQEIHRLPELMLAQLGAAAGPRWQLELCGLAKTPLTFEIVADVVLGVNRGLPEGPDLDLGPYSAESKGVSRRHALLRPTWNHLFLIDLESTNGTRINSIWVTAGMAKDVRKGDIISLGKLSFTICSVVAPRRNSD
jgi:hypothetical protein